MTESTTLVVTPGNGLSEEEMRLEAANWDQVTMALPEDLETTAKAQGALVRRREIRCVLDLLRMIFAYAVCDWSLRLVGAWLVTMGLADLSDVAMLKRLEHSTTWLGHLIVRLLQQRQGPLTRRAGVRLRLRDASRVVDSHKRIWRLHASFDLGELYLAGVEVTDDHGAESLARFPVQPDEIELADRGYATPASLGQPLACGGRLVARTHWKNLAYQDEEGQRVDVLAWLRSLAASGCQQPVERAIWLDTPDGRFRLRLLAIALPPEAQARIHRQVRAKAAKKGRTPSPDNLFAAGFILVLTNLDAPAWPASQVLELYRLRWQIELLFKRYKSIFRFDALRAHKPAVVQTYLLAKLLAAMLLDHLLQTTQDAVPEWFDCLERPISVWRLSHWWWDQLRSWVQGSLSHAQTLAALPRLRRFFCDSPRRRPQQLANARAFLNRLSLVNVQSVS